MYFHVGKSRCRAASELRKCSNNCCTSFNSPKITDNSYRDYYGRNSRLWEKQSQVNHCQKKIKILLCYMWMYSYKPLLKRKSLGSRYENAAVDEIKAIQGHSFLCNFMIAEFFPITFSI